MIFSSSNTSVEEHDKDSLEGKLLDIMLHDATVLEWIAASPDSSTRKSCDNDSRLVDKGEKIIK